MVLGLVSDSHGKSEILQKAVSMLSDADLIIHLGDGASDWENLTDGPKCGILQILGNCDWGCAYSTTSVQAFNGIGVLCTHGHLYGVKLGLTRLYLAAAERGVKIACYGHTHVPMIDIHDGIFVINPGSIADSRTFARIVLQDDGKILPEIKRIP